MGRQAQNFQDTVTKAMPRFFFWEGGGTGQRGVEAGLSCGKFAGCMMCWKFTLYAWHGCWWISQKHQLSFEWDTSRSLG